MAGIGSRRREGDRDVLYPPALYSSFFRLAVANERLAPRLGPFPAICPPVKNITINAVAPGVTSTSLIADHFLDIYRANDLAVSTPYSVGLALAYSATAKQSRRVEAYGKERQEENLCEGRWNGRVILVVGDRYTELEEPLVDIRPNWFGVDNEEWARAQQAALDCRDHPHIAES